MVTLAFAGCLRFLWITICSRTHFSTPILDFISQPLEPIYFRRNSSSFTFVCVRAAAKVVNVKIVFPLPDRIWDVRIWCHVRIWWFFFLQLQGWKIVSKTQGFNMKLQSSSALYEAMINHSRRRVEWSYNTTCMYSVVSISTRVVFSPDGDSGLTLTIFLSLLFLKRIPWALSAITW